MAEAFLTAELARRAALDSHITVRSAGVMRRPSEPANPSTVKVMAEGGIDMSAHRSSTLQPQDMAAADLVVTMERAHLRAAAVMIPQGLDKTFTLRDLVRRGHHHGGRRPGESTVAWLARVGADRDPADLLYDDADDNVTDPQGRPLPRFRDTAQQISALVADLSVLLFGPPDPPAC